MDFVSMYDLQEKAAGFYNCSLLTIRNFLYKNPDKFEFRRGLIRVKLIETSVEQVEDLKEFEEWTLNRTAVLEECMEFLKVQNMTPYVENLLTLAGNARDQFKSYCSTDVVFLMFALKNEFGFSPKSMLKEGGLINAE